LGKKKNKFDIENYWFKTIKVGEKVVPKGQTLKRVNDNKCGKMHRIGTGFPKER
jgi:hypothetical protein